MGLLYLLLLNRPGFRALSDIIFHVRFKDLQDNIFM